MLKMLMNHSVEAGWTTSNPTSAIKKMRTNTQGFHTWGENELERFFEYHKAGSVAHTAVTLMGPELELVLSSGYRGDCARGLRSSQIVQEKPWESSRDSMLLAGWFES